MSLVDLTRNAFQSGLSPAKWVALCKLYRSKHEPIQDSKNFECSLSNSVLVLYRSYPGHLELQDYLKIAIREGMLSLSVFVTTLLQAARSPELHIPATLEILCRVALDAHYSSGLPARSSVVSDSESTTMVLGMVRDALALLRTAHSLPIFRFHNLRASASELTVLILSCVTDLSQVSAAQAMAHFADVNDILQTLNISDDLRQLLQTFIFSLSMLMGDDIKVSRETRLMQNVHVSIGKGDLLGPASNDIVTMSFMLQQLVRHRARAFGSGSSSESVALFLATLRWTAWTPAVFYTQLLLSAFRCLSQSAPFSRGAGSTLLWKSFLVARLPRLLVAFEASVKIDSANDIDWRAAMQSAMTSVLRLNDLVSHCNRIASHPIHSSSSQDSSRIFSRAVLQQFLANGLIDRAFALSVDPGISNDNSFSLQAEALDVGLDLEAFLDSKFTLDAGTEHLKSLVERILEEPLCHAEFAEVVRKRFETLTGTLDLDSFHNLCKALYLDDAALDVISLHVKISDLVFYGLSFLEEYECDTVGDPQTAVSHLGDVVLFLQSALSRYHLTQEYITLGKKRLSTAFLRSTTTVNSTHNLAGEDATTFNTWFKALFDYNSDGIEDTMFRSTSPKTLLEIAATLFSHAIQAYSDNKISSDVLTNGVAYFTGSLLNWTLVGVVKMLLKDIEKRSSLAMTRMDILQTLLLSPDCPRPVLCLCGPSILNFLHNRSGQVGTEIETSLRQVTLKALEIPEKLPSTPPSNLVEYPKIVIREALAAARSASAVSFDVEYCVLLLSPTPFLRLLWSELSAAANKGEMDICKRIATLTLTVPLPSGPPLLPVFLHIVVPSLIVSIDRQDVPERNMNIDFLVAVISSVLVASLHLEWAIHLVTGETRYALGQSSAASIRRFAGTLRSRSPASNAIAQRLTSSPSFLSNFPTFTGELEM